MKQETLEEAKERYLDSPLPHSYKLAVEFGAKWQKERSYSEEDIRNAIDYGAELGLSDNIGNSFEWTKRKNEWFEQFKKK
jgi:formylglycine-generating enzyme required for sulfatase activity